MAVFDNSRAMNEAGIDQITNNQRSRGSSVPITVRSVTFPAAPLGICYYQGAGTPISVTSGSNIALDTGQLLSGICVLKPSANVNLTFDTAAQIVAGVNAIGAGAVVGDVICTLIINGATANTLAPQTSTGVTYDSNQANTTIAANSSRLMYFRLTNVTSGSEAVVVYW